MEDHFEIGLVLEALPFGLDAGEFDVGGVEADGGGGNRSAGTWLSAAAEATFGKGLGEVFVEFFAVVEPPLGLFGFRCKFRNDSLFHALSRPLGSHLQAQRYV